MTIAPTQASIENICIAVPTFRRETLLASLIDTLAIEIGDARPPRVEVTIVDNDPHGSARALVLGRREQFPVNLHYALVPEPGLSVVRNFALQFALSRGFDTLVMIDDDARPDPGWLAELLRVARETGADAVEGVALATFEDPPPDWVVETRFFAPQPIADRARLEEFSTANVLIRTAVAERYHLAFDRVLNLTGGEDQLFSRQLIARGGRVVRAAHAIVRETVPPSRATLRYLLLRNMRYGNCWVIGNAGVVRPGLRRVAYHLKDAGTALAGGLFALPALTARHGRGGAARAAFRMARGVGVLLGICGVKVLEYGRPGESPEAAPATLELDQRACADGLEAEAPNLTP